MANNRRDFIKRAKLIDSLPLETPFTVYVDPSSICNFKCDFCYHSLDKKTLEDKGFDRKVMDMETYRKVINDISEFPDKIKMLALFMNGEPFVNKSLIDMIAYAKERDIASRIYIATNGSLLNEETSRNLAESGVDEILISVEATDSEGYKKITGFDLDYEQFIKRISHFYENRGSCKLYAKIVLYDKNPEQEALFHSIFDSITDFAYTELVAPIISDVDYSALNLGKAAYERVEKKVDICPRAFFSMCVHADGRVGVCSVDYIPEVSLGNIHGESLTDIWNGEKMRNFRMTQVNGKRYDIRICKECKTVLVDTLEEDILDGYACILKEAYGRGAD